MGGGGANEGNKARVLLGTKRDEKEASITSLFPSHLPTTSLWAREDLLDQRRPERLKVAAEWLENLNGGEGMSSARAEEDGWGSSTGAEKETRRESSAEAKEEEAGLLQDKGMSSGAL